MQKYAVVPKGYLTLVLQGSDHARSEVSTIESLKMVKLCLHHKDIYIFLIGGSILQKILITLGAVLLLTSCALNVSSSSKKTDKSSIQTNATTSPQPLNTQSVILTSLHQQDPAGYVSTPNHSSIIQKEEVAIPAGKATLLTIEQDNFTAVTAQEPGAKTDIVYWLYISKPSAADSTVNDTYILSGLVTGDAASAKDELLEAAKTWNPPFK